VDRRRGEGTPGAARRAKGREATLEVVQEVGGRGEEGGVQPEEVRVVKLEGEEKGERREPVVRRIAAEGSGRHRRGGGGKG